MSEEQNTPPRGATPPADQGAKPTTIPGAMPDTTEQTLTLEQALHQLKERQEALDATRKESIKHRKRLDDFEAAEKARTDAQLSEQERLQKQYTDLQSQHTEYTRVTQERLVRYEIERSAAKLGIIDPDAAVKLLDWSELEFSEDGTPQNTDALLEKLVKQRPYLGQPTTQTIKTPALPAMNPGRSSIQPPATPQSAGRIPRLSDVFRKQ